MTERALENNADIATDQAALRVGIKQPLNRPSLDHVDLITGEITGVKSPDDPGYAVPNASGVKGEEIPYNLSTKIAQQIPARHMKAERRADGSTRLTFTTTFAALNTPSYIRARGTNIPVATPNVTNIARDPLLDVNNALVNCTDPDCPMHLNPKSPGKDSIRLRRSKVAAWDDDLLASLIATSSQV